ncbi:M28 family peptidase [Aminipila luticellarii]|uniref:M28 family peptidase n=1 Tax=Aminipila luticellarii TaxID=2507160 RepID=A0A410PSE8_9FIRM|nr:M28 family peptidase [Aminipila luticellarii]QAT41840.1 M28 family peptidase [Aminipila luticellarii]
MSLYERLKEEISLDELYENMSYLVEEVGERLSGTEEMRKATAYICSKLTEYGVDAHIDHFPMYQSYPGEAALKVMEPCTKEIKARPVCHIQSTAEEGIEGELMYVGSGSYKDYEGKDAKGKIILTDMNWSPGRPEKARIAWELGAKALIIMNWGRAEEDLIQMGAVKTQWGNPTPDTEKDIVELPVISISRRDGEYLEALCQKGKTTVWLKANASREWITADQPVGIVRGKQSKGQYVLVGSHVDAWGKSAICNASGDSLNLELARVFQKHCAELKRDVVFVFWDGHEIAEGGGSTWYCDSHWAEMNEGCVAYINVDNLAIKGTTIPGVEGQPEMKQMLMEAIKTIWDTEGVWHQAYKGGGDSSFFGVGVPYISFATEYTEEKLKELNYAFYSPWLHSDSDTIDKLDRELLKKHSEFFAYITEKLVNAPLVLYDMKALAQDVKYQWEAILTEAGRATEMILDTTPIVDQYVAMLEKLDLVKISLGNDETKAALYNKLVILCERQTAMFRGYSGRYGQDGCCALQTENPIPALDKAIKKYNEAPLGSHEYYLWETQILRVRNMVYDAMNYSIRYVELGLSAMD